MEKEMDFQDVIRYAVELPKEAFSNYAEAEEGYRKHLIREKQRNVEDPLKTFFTQYQNKYRRKLRRVRSSWYDFHEIKHLLKKHYLWGWQVFDSRSMRPDHTECIYYSRYGVQIDVCYDYTYIEVMGLRHDDFKVLQRAHEAAYGYSDTEEDDYNDYNANDDMC